MAQFSIANTYTSKVVVGGGGSATVKPVDNN